MNTPQSNLSTGPRVPKWKLWVGGLLVATGVTLPFLIWGEEFVMPLLEARKLDARWLLAVAVALLAIDSVAPVPATLVIMFLAAQGGWLMGIVGGTVGLAAGVVIAGLVGKNAVGRIAPAFFPDAELARIRESLQSRLHLTLACLRSVPIAAETSVIIAAASGVPLRKIVMATLLPNFVISVIYSVAADDSFTTASITFLATAVLSYGVWRFFGQRAR